MSDKFKAAFHTTKFILSRSVMQVILEVPLEAAHSVHDIIGYPRPGEEKWVEVELLDAGK